MIHCTNQIDITLPVTDNNQNGDNSDKDSHEKIVSKIEFRII